MQRNAASRAQLEKAGFTPEHHIYFLCRSGVRSLAAAEAAQAAGFPHVLQTSPMGSRATGPGRYRAPRPAGKAEGLALAAEVIRQSRAVTHRELRAAPGQKSARQPRRMLSPIRGHPACPIFIVFICVYLCLLLYFGGGAARSANRFYVESKEKHRCTTDKHR